VIPPFSDELEGGRCGPRLQLVERLGRGRWGVEYPGMGDHCNELVDTRPGNRPSTGRFGLVSYRLSCFLVERGVAPVGVDQEVGVDGDQSLDR
jgi:hypothetical protein